MVALFRREDADVVTGRKEDNVTRPVICGVDPDLVTANGPLRVFTLLQDARPVLLNLGEPAASTSHHGHIGFS
jgi:hypothetical protein